MNVTILTVNGHKVKVTTDQEITEAWKKEMIEWIERTEREIQAGN